MNHDIRDHEGGDGGLFQERHEFVAEGVTPLLGIEGDEHAFYTHRSRAFPASTIRDQLRSCASNAALPWAVI